MVESDEGSIRNIASMLLDIVRKQDLPSLRQEVQSQATNISNALAAPKYIVQEPSAILTNEQALSSLATGYMKVTNGTGVVSSQAVPIPAADGGTGQSSYAVGDLLYASGATTLSKLADVATGNALISGGVATAPGWGKIGLTTHISGILGSANGGTGVDNGARTLTVSTNSGILDFTSSSTTLTIPTTGTVALRGTAQTFTALQTFSAHVNASRIGLGNVAGTPSFLLHISTDSVGTTLIETTADGVNPVVRIKDNSPGQAVIGAFNFLSNSDVTKGQIAYYFSSTEQNMRFLAAGAEVFRITSAAAMWIGKTSGGLTGAGDVDANGNVRGSAFRVGTNQVLGARITGWGSPTGTATRTTFDTTTVTLAQLAERVKALIDDAKTHGFLGI